jgi:hypothetical protein
MKHSLPQRKGREGWIATLDKVDVKPDLHWTKRSKRKDLQWSGFEPKTCWCHLKRKVPLAGKLPLH